MWFSSNSVTKAIVDMCTVSYVQLTKDGIQLYFKDNSGVDDVLLCYGKDEEASNDFYRLRKELQMYKEG